VLYRVPVAGGRPEALQVSPDAFDGRLSPDGAWYAYTEYKDAWGFIEVTPTRGGAPRRLTRRTERVYQSDPLWSPDGTRLTVSEADYTGATLDLREMSVNDTTRRRLTRSPKSDEQAIAYTRDGRVLFEMSGQDHRVMSVAVGDLLAGSVKK